MPHRKQQPYCLRLTLQHMICWRAWIWICNLIACIFQEYSTWSCMHKWHEKKLQTFCIVVRQKHEWWYFNSRVQQRQTDKSKHINMWEQRQVVWEIQTDRYTTLQRVIKMCTICDQAVVDSGCFVIMCLFVCFFLNSTPKLTLILVSALFKGTSTVIGVACLAFQFVCVWGETRGAICLCVAGFAS